jgi:hypothetical protein
MTNMNTHLQAGKRVGVSHLIDWRMVVDTHGAIISGACSNHWIDGPPGLLLTTAKKDRKKERKKETTTTFVSVASNTKGLQCYSITYLFFTTPCPHPPPATN